MMGQDIFDPDNFRFPVVIEIDELHRASGARRQLDRLRPSESRRRTWAQLPPLLPLVARLQVFQQAAKWNHGCAWIAGKPVKRSVAAS